MRHYTWRVRGRFSALAANAPSEPENSNTQGIRSAFLSGAATHAWPTLFQRLNGKKHAALPSLEKCMPCYLGLGSMVALLTLVRKKQIALWDILPFERN